MKKSNTKQRLRQIIEERKITQSEILKAAKPYCEKFNVKLNKSNMSQYVSGKNEPGQDKIAVLSMALDVSEGWLMGYDVPMERQTQDKEKPAAVSDELWEKISNNEIKLDIARTIADMDDESLLLLKSIFESARLQPRE